MVIYGLCINIFHYWIIFFVNVNEDSNFALSHVTDSLLKDKLSELIIIYKNNKIETTGLKITMLVTDKILKRKKYRVIYELKRNYTWKANPRMLNPEVVRIFFYNVSSEVVCM